MPGSRRIGARSARARPKPSSSPYFGIDEHEWVDVTLDLIDRYPLDPGLVVDVVLHAWEGIFESSLGGAFRIGQHIFPKPQVMGFLLHELIPLEIERRLPGEWRAERTAADKDIVFVADDAFSTELKTSSHDRQIFANRSFGVEVESEEKKRKAGYYIAVNFEPWPARATAVLDEQVKPRVRLIRLGWLDHTDWVAQRAESGQQSSLPPLVENNQLLTIYP